MEAHDFEAELLRLINEHLAERGMKAHIGVDSDKKPLHSSVVTAANVRDSQALADLLHGEETRVRGDSAYTGQTAVLAEHTPHAQDFTHTRACRNAPLTENDTRKNRTKSKVHDKVEHVFRVVKCQFDLPRSVIAAWLRTPITCSRRSHW